jgi:hypothetical protein
MVGENRLVLLAPCRLSSPQAVHQQVPLALFRLRCVFFFSGALALATDRRLLVFVSLLLPLLQILPMHL